MLKIRQYALSGAMLPALFFLTSCGGGDNTTTTTTTTPSVVATTEVINGITVPVAPDATMNAATLKGVDSNNNGVRDDVERQISKAANSTSQFDTASKLANAYQALITNPTPVSRQSALLVEKSILCSVSDSTLIPTSLKNLSDTSVESLVFNTDERKDKLLALRELVGGYDSTEVNCGN
jgi:hypothetical protein